MSVFAATSDILLPGCRLSNGEEKNKQYNYNDNTGEAVFKVVLVVSKEAPAAKSRIHQTQSIKQKATLETKNIGPLAH